MFNVKQKIVCKVKSLRHVIIGMTEMEVYTTGRGIKMGALAGHIAAWSILGLILGIDGTMRLPTGTFYSVIGVTFGLTGASAMQLGFILHLVTGTIIGALFGYMTSVIRGFHIANIKKALVLSVITGIVTWLVLFLPITVFIVQPSLESIAATLGVPMLDEMLPMIIGGSVGMHVIYGGMLGFMYWLAVVPSSYEYTRRAAIGT
jgi:hypothetical protein